MQGFDGGKDNGSLFIVHGKSLAMTTVRLQTGTMNHQL
jgi:hypothetical protein